MVEILSILLLHIFGFMSVHSPRPRPSSATSGISGSGTSTTTTALRPLPVLMNSTKSTTSTEAVQIVQNPHKLQGHVQAGPEHYAGLLSTRLLYACRGSASTGRPRSAAESRMLFSWLQIDAICSSHCFSPSVSVSKCSSPST